MSTSTRDRILAAAEASFVAHGFDGSTVRAIAAAADVNLNAINYHFGDKERLYAEVVAGAHQRMLGTERPPIPPATSDDQTGKSGDPRVCLRELIAWQARRILSAGCDTRGGAFHIMMTREMSAPTGALDELINVSIRPVYDAFATLIRAMFARNADCSPDDFSDEVIRRSIFSIIGQVLVYKHAWPAVSRLQPSLTMDAEEVARLSEHITRFSLAGLDAVCTDWQKQHAGAAS